MPQQLLLDISGASARSKGQARRRNQPAVSEDARKAQRNLARRERAKCNKAGKTDRQLSSSAQSFPLGTRPRYDFPSPSTGKAAEKLLEMPVLPPPPAFTVLPAHANNINLRALAQPGKDIAARPQVQHAKDVVPEDVQQAEDVSVIQARDRVEPQIAPQEKGRDAAGILVEVARKQHPISPTIDMGTMSVKERGASNASASTEYSRKCLVTTCSYHLDIGPWSKIEKDKHTMTHFEGNIKVCTDKGRYSLPWPNFIDAPEEYFSRIRIFRCSIELLHQWDTHDRSHDFRGLKCMICFGDFGPSGYLEHLDDCIVYAVQLQALGMGQPCPVPLCEHHPTRLPSRSSMDQYMIKPYWPSLGCGRCYTDQCQCPPSYAASREQIASQQILTECGLDSRSDAGNQV